MQYDKNETFIKEIDKSLKNGPVINSKGKNMNKVAGNS